MSEQTTSFPDDLRSLLTEAGPDAYALAYADTVTDPVVWETAQAPAAGETGAVRSADGLARLTVQEVCRGQQETLRRWLQLDDGRRQLAIIAADLGGLREHTPGELAADLLRDPASDEAQLTSWLASWMYLRYADAPEGVELGWIAASAAWTCHMRALASYPPPPVLSSAMASAGERDEATRELVTSTGLKLADLLDRMERPYRPRTELVEDWRTAQSLSADVPALRPSADWLLDQIALRDAQAQQLRAALEPDITDHLRDRKAGYRLDALAPALDAQRTAHLGQAREVVRNYTAAAYSGREREAQLLLDAFPVPARALDVSGPARAWRLRSATAQDAVDALAARREAAMSEDGTEYFADPERLHAESAYLAAREGQLHLVHDALGRLAHPAALPSDVPEELADVPAGQPQRRLTEAFGTPERALQVLDGQLNYLRQQPVPAHRRSTASAEIDLLAHVRDQLHNLTQPDLDLDADQIRTRLEAAMTRPATAERPARAAAAHDQAHTEGLLAGPSTTGVQR